MKTRDLRTSASICGVVLAVLILLQAPAQAQKAPTQVTVANTSANPVPVSGSVSVTNLPAVQLDPNANVVKLDSNANTVRVDPNASIKVDTRCIANVETFNWTGQASVFSFQWTESLHKVRVCVAHTGPNGVVVGVNGTMNSVQFTIDQFSIASPNTVCRIYEIPGAYIYVTAHNVGGSTSGLVRVGYWGIY